MPEELTETDAVIHLSGDVDMATTPWFREHIRSRIARADVSQIVVEFSRTAFIDSLGLGMLVAMREECRRAGKPLLLRSMSAMVDRTMQIAGLADLFEWID